jgi:DNA-nicking Smr family endonuclease
MNGIPELDLHGLGVNDALRTTREFLELSREKGFLTVSVIFGKGKGSPGGEGVLRVVVPRAIAVEWTDIVEDFRRHVDWDGRDAGVEVVLRPVE